MKKTLIPFLGALTLLACNRQDAPAVSENEQPQTISRSCASHEILERQIAADPARGQALEELERRTESFQGRQNRAAGVLYVPVWVNVVLPNANQVSDDLIASQIEVLNKDFNATNAELGNSSVYLAGYPLTDVANTQVTFVLKGVTRKSSSAPASFGTNDAVKRTSQGGQDATNASRYLNLWVCDLSSGLLGYAQFPNGSASTDGVVVDYQAFGLASRSSYPMYSAFNLGRTATHEVGHWFNLRHIWGDARCGNDFVGDTPQHDADNGGCPAVGLRSRCTGKPLEQWMNYMDYTNDACMYMFTSGQKQRMDAAIDLSRAGWVYTSTTAIP